MKTKKRNAMMYKAIKAEYDVNFKMSFFELSSHELYLLADFAELFRIRSEDGASPARTLFYRMRKTENEMQREA